MDQGVKDQPFTDEQKSYLEGFFAGGDLGRTMRSLPTFASALGLKPEQLPGNGRLLNEQDGAAAVPTGPEAIHYFAQDRQVAEGKKLTPGGARSAPLRRAVARAVRGGRTRGGVTRTATSTAI